MYYLQVIQEAIRKLETTTMASRQSTQKLFQAYPRLKLGVQKVQQEVFGYFPQLNIRTGNQKAKKALTGVYLNRYYLDTIDKTARKVRM